MTAKVVPEHSLRSLRYDAVLFDLDGVLVNSYPLVTECHRRTIEKFCGKAITLSDFNVPWGTTFIEQLSYLMDATQCSPLNPSDTMLSYWRNNYVELHGILVSVHRGVRDLLKYFLQQRLPFGVISNRDRARFCLAFNLIPELRFACCLVSGDDVLRPKPYRDSIVKGLATINTLPERALYVGDTIYDLFASRDAGVDCFLVLSRVSAGDLAVSGVKPIGTVDSADDLASALASLFRESDRGSQDLAIGTLK